MNKFRGNIITKKDFSLALLVFILPFLSYLHLTFIEFEGLRNLFRAIDVFSLYGETDEDIIAITYSILTWFAYLLLLLICYASLKNDKIKPFYLFPIYLATRKLSIYVFLFLDGFKHFDTFVTLTLAIIFITYFVAKNRHFTFNSFFNLPAIVLISLPFFNELWKIYPYGTEKLRFLFFEINENGFSDAQATIYHILEKLSFIIPCLVYFFWQKRWIKYAFLAPIIIYSSQLYNLLFVDFDFLDEIEIYQTAKFTIPLLGILLLLAKANDHQERIKHWIANHYSVVETKLKVKYLWRDNQILESRKKMKAAKSKLADLEQLKIELEQELRNINSD